MESVSRTLDGATISLTAVLLSHLFADLTHRARRHSLRQR